MAALKFIDDRGLNALTLRALASSLGVYPAAVSWHAGNKDELLNAVANEVLAGVAVPEDGLSCHDWLTAFGVNFRAAVQRHPNTAPILGGTLLMTPALVPSLEGVLRRLETIGFEGRGLVQAYNVYAGYVIGYTINELSQKPERVSDDWEHLAEAFLDKLPEAMYPTITKNLPLLKNHAIAFRWQSWTTSSLLDSYEFGIDVLLSGLEMMVGSTRSVD